MPTTSENSFVDRWEAKQRQLGFNGLETSFIECGDAVLPNEAAPCLSFDDATTMPAIWELFSPGSWWPATDKQRLDKYRMIGADGAGNPICVECASGEVWLLDHEDHFRTSQFVNSGISQFAECLLAYMGEKDGETFRSAVTLIDPSALQQGSFWYHEAAGVGAYID